MLKPDVSWLLKAFKPSQRQTTQTSGVESSGTQINEQGTWVTGQVVRAGAGSYDVVVHTESRGDLNCVVAPQLAHAVIGTSQAYVPSVGTTVAVYLPNSKASYGYVMAVLPPVVQTMPNVAKPLVPLTLISPESSAARTTEKAYSIPFSNKDDQSKSDASNGRPADLAPGDMAYRSDQGVLFHVGRLSAMLSASPSASVRVSLLDDNVRISSGHFQHYNAGGMTQIFNDGGLISSELGITSHQCEKSGFNEYGTDAFEGDKDSNQGWLKKLLKTRWNSVKRRITAKKRLQIFTGYLGDMVNIFVAKPDPSQNPETEDAKSKDQGLMQAHVDSSGRVILRTAAGMSLQRWDRIPIPKRIRQPWDPKGIKAETTTPTTDKLPFQFASQYPYARPLLLRDAMAWRNKQAVQRIHEHTEPASRADFYVPEESELTSPPDNTYDELGKGQEDFKSNDYRHSFVNLEDDGSIVIRDAWGSEIALRGGNIVITCPGQIEMRSGKSIVALAGHDLILKAKESADLTATNRDVRIKAESNLQMAAGSDDGATGSVLIESKSKGNGAWSGQGEAARGTGIVLKAAESTVYAEGKTVHVSGSENVDIETFDSEGNNNGIVRISANELVSNTKQRTRISSGDSSQLLLTRTNAWLAGLGAYVAGATRASIMRGDQAMAAQWGDTDRNYYDIISAALPQLNETLQATDWLAPFSSSARTSIKFTFRSAAEYGTILGTEVYKAPSFYVYQSMWSYLMSKGFGLIEGELDKWKENSINDTYPWPGKENYEGSPYVVLTGEVNIKDAKTGIAKNRKELKATSSGCAVASFDEYEVVRHT